MTPASMAQVRNAVAQALRVYAGATAGAAASAVSVATTRGKVYEAHVLSHVIQRLVMDENHAVSLVGGNTLRLRAAPGVIDRHGHAYFRVETPAGNDCELWTDLEVFGMSPALQQRAASRADASELDIALIDPGLAGRPTPPQVWLGVECKHTAFRKEYLRGFLGLRRQLSLLRDPIPTRFVAWPAATIPAEPPSCLMLWSSDQGILNHAEVGRPFGVMVSHVPI